VSGNIRDLRLVSQRLDCVSVGGCMRMARLTRLGSKLFIIHIRCGKSLLDSTVLSPSTSTSLEANVLFEGEKSGRASANNDIDLLLPELDVLLPVKFILNPN
jgi:hypothetical protein